MTGKKTICLNMIVKNESLVMDRLLDSVAGIVTDYVIVDTGSSDNTCDILLNRGIQVYYDTFVNFGVNRTSALNLARHYSSSDYILFLDADMVFNVGNVENFFFTLSQQNADVVYVQQQLGSIIYQNVRFIKRDLQDVTCVGPTHEYYSYPSNATVYTMPNTLAWIDDKGDGGCRSEKFSRDLKLLTTALDTDPTNHRNTFYLAQTFKDMNDYDSSIEMYKRRIELGGWVEEVAYSMYMVIRISICHQGDTQTALKYVEQFRLFERQRPEPYYFMCTYYREHNDIPEACKYFALATIATRYCSENKPLFYDTDIVSLFLPYEESILWYYLHPKPQVSIQSLCFYLLNHERVPVWIKDVVQDNKEKFYTLQ